ncbi:hypothetical protein Pcinc_009832 [Petrolisthes cinctipes]|uniref:Uncharacterized protein n=1 Tax=Petrolisthes cinctipes TaxID=88211 RepID=A0AAE1G4K4_PETCI|nr:hypothetical protein Pcinc_009832 [Petrolisthes cinctipes]
MVKQSSAFQGMKMKALWLHAVKKRRTLSSCFMWPMLQRMTTVKFKFVVLLYDRTSPYMDVNEARKKLFAKRNSVQRSPPTYDALEQHMKRSVFQGGYVWGQVLVPQPVLPSPTSWGDRQTEDGSYELL